MKEEKYPNWFKRSEKAIALCIVIITLLTMVCTITYIIGLKILTIIILGITLIIIIGWAFRKTFPGLFNNVMI